MIYKKKFTIYEILSLTGLIIYIFVVFFGTSGPAWSEDSNDASEMIMSNPLNQLIYSFVFVLSFIPLLKEHKKVLAWINEEKFLVFFLLWCGVSIIWSEDWLVSSKRFFQYLITQFVFISVLINFRDEKVIVKTLTAILLCFVIISVGISLTIPQAIDPSHGSWRGLHNGKNGLGQSAGINLLFFSFMFLTERLNHFKIIYFFALLLSLILLMGSTSATSIISILMISMFFLFRYIDNIFRPLHLGKTFSFFLIICFSSIIIMTLIFLPDKIDNVFSSIGKDPTMTGRTDIWIGLLAYQQDQLTLGAGYQSFWIPNLISNLSIFGPYWVPNQAHNGYVDMILEIGIVGLIIFLIFLIHSLKRFFKMGSSVWLVFMVFALFINFQESTFLRPHHLTNVFFFMSFWILAFRLRHNNSIIQKQ